MKRSQRSINKNNGFTLLEVMVVIALMAIMTAFAVPYLSGSQSELLQKEMDGFQTRVVYAQTQAILQSQDLGLIVNEEGYQFVQRVKAKWEVFEEEPLQSHAVDSSFKHRLLVEDIEVEQEILDDPELLKPSVLFYSSGEMSAFKYELALSEQHYLSLEFDPLGESKQVLFSE